MNGEALRDHGSSWQLTGTGLFYGLSLSAFSLLSSVYIKAVRFFSPRCQWQSFPRENFSFCFPLVNFFFFFSLLFFPEFSFLLASQ